MTLKISFKDLHFKGTTGSNCHETAEAVKINIFGDWAPELGGRDLPIYKETKDYFVKLTPFLKNSDLNIVNFETSMGGRSGELFHKPSVKLTKGELSADCLREMGFDLFCLANNHILDNGKSGLARTKAYIESFGGVVTGAGLNLKEVYSPFKSIIKKNKVAIVNCSSGEEANEKFNDGLGAADFESHRVYSEIRNLRKNEFFVIIVVHAGIEFIPAPPPFIKRIYREYIDAGAGAVIGHHPHVVQGMELYQNCPIIYSLGNFGIYRQFSREKEKEGAFISLEIIENEIAMFKIIPYRNTYNCLKILKSDEKKKWALELKMISSYISKPKNMLLWDTYILKNNPFRIIAKLNSKIKTNRYQAKTLLKNTLQQNSYGYFMNDGYFDRRVDDYSKTSLLLKRYGAYKKESLGERIFLQQVYVVKYFYLFLQNTSKLLHKVLRRLNS